ncbi:MAG: GNAT family N-acetyltransferase [Rhizobiales bacterium]|nr:GNAT family N-acetyltransferase [Hyphomicrobiales bacterium]
MTHRHETAGATQIGTQVLARPAREMDNAGLGPLIQRVGAFEIRIAATRKEIGKARRLRFKTFYEEGGAVATLRERLSRREYCPFDALCDHIVVVDTQAVGASGRRKRKVIATCRLLRGEIARLHGGFCTQNEFDLDGLLALHGDKRIVEIGRACVAQAYRRTKGVELLWRGVWAYIAHHRIDMMIGCASFPGREASAHAGLLSFLHHAAPAPAALCVAPVAGRRADFVLQPMREIEQRRALAALPPLIKAYLRLGATFGDGAVVDHQFATVDVFTLLTVETMRERFQRFDPARMLESSAVQ